MQGHRKGAHSAAAGCALRHRGKQISEVRAVIGVVVTRLCLSNSQGSGVRSSVSMTAS